MGQTMLPNESLFTEFVRFTHNFIERRIEWKLQEKKHIELLINCFSETQFDSHVPIYLIRSCILMTVIY